MSATITSTFTWKDYRHEASVALMTLSSAEFMRRFLRHVLPDGFQRIRHYGFLANGTRQTKLARIRQLLPPVPQQQVVPVTQDAVTATIAPEDPAASVTEDVWQPTCPECGGQMQIVETLPEARRNGLPRIDTS